MRVIAFDSKKILRSTLKEGAPFKALIGVGVTISNYEEYSKIYNHLLDNIFKEYDLIRNKRIYKSRDLMSIFYGLNVDIIKILAERLIKSLDFIDIYYSYFSDDFYQTSLSESIALSHINLPNKMKIGVYWDQELKHLSPSQF